LARLRILVDNRAVTPGVRPEWGLSILLERDDGGLVLWDAGLSGETLCYNASVLGLLDELRSLEAVFISHLHRDHYGGLSCVAHYAPGTPVYMPPGPGHVAAWARRLGLAPIVVEKPLRAAGVAATRALPSGIGLMERALAYRSRGGLIVLLGCSHPGADRLLDEALRETGEEKAVLLVGGVHGAPPSVVDHLAGKAERMALIHCSGSAAEYAKRRYPRKTLESGAGSVLLA